MKTNRSSELSILVVSCDAYSDLWPTFFKLFDKYWPACPYPIYLQTNNQKYEYRDLHIIKVGEDIDWSSNLQSALDEIPTSYVLLLLEDFFLCRPVDMQKIEAAMSLMHSEGAGYCRLVPKPPPDIIFNENLDFGKISKDQDYRMSFQASIWDKRVLKKLLQPGENAWKAEMEGSVRSNDLPCEFLSFVKSAYSDWPMHYMNAVIKRKWTPEVVKFCRESKIFIDLTKRPVCNWYDQIRRKRFFRASLSRLICVVRFVLGEKLYSHIKTNRILKKIVY